MCIFALAGCSVARGPVTRPPDQALPPDVLHDQLAELQEGDRIELHLTDRSVQTRTFVSAGSGRLHTWSGRAQAPEDHVDPYDTIAGIRRPEFSPVRSLVAVTGVLAALLALAFAVECSSGCFE